MDHSTHTLYYFGLYCQASIKFLFMLKESRSVLHKFMSYNLLYFIPCAFNSLHNKHLGVDI